MHRTSFRFGLLLFFRFFFLSLFSFRNNDGETFYIDEDSIGYWGDVNTKLQMT